MAVTLAAEVQVDTKDLRNALRAVTPHAEPNKTGDLDAEHRVRLVIDDFHVNVLASNGSTAAMAIVSIEDDSRTERFAVDDGPLIVDLTPRQARLILAQFKAKKTDPEGVDQSCSCVSSRTGKASKSSIGPGCSPASPSGSPASVSPTTSPTSSASSRGPSPRRPRRRRRSH
jgi:hypothetical protein